MKMYDVIISGSGPAGSTAGEICARNGLRTLIFEKNSIKPRFEKPCGGGIPKNLVTELNIDESVLENKIIGHTIYAPSGNNCTIGPENDFWGYIVRRSKFDAFFSDRAQDSGVIIKDNSRVIDVIKKNGKIIGVKVKEDNIINEYFANIIIAADGVGSKIAIKSGLREKWDNLDLGYCAVAFVEGFKNENPQNQNYNHVYFSNYFAPNCYVWIFPLKNGLANVGTALYDRKSENPMNYLKKFLNWNGLKDKFSKINITWHANFPVPYNGIKGKTFDDNIMCIGDAAGFVSPYLGEGIYYAIYSGVFAGETSILAYEKEDFSKSTLRFYRKKYRKHNFTSIFLSHQTFRNSLMNDLDHKYEALVDLFKENKEVQKIFVESILSESKDFTGDVLEKTTKILENESIKEKLAMILQ